MSSLPVIENAFEPGGLLAKSQLYMEEMQSHDQNDWLYAFWSALSLELLGRAALASISPALLADTASDWNNLYLALGHQPTSPKFVPKSITVSDVFNRLQAINPDFTPEMRSFCSLHTGHRNAELHSAEMAFVKLNPAIWLPNYFKSVDILAQMAGSSLERLVGDEIAAAARQVISAAADKAAESVKADIAAFRKVWESKEKSDQHKLSSQSELWASGRDGHVTRCPSCQSDALLTGEPISPARKTISHDIITERQEHLPKVFECVACGLKISGLSRLAAAGMGAPFTHRTEYDAVDYYASEPDYEYAEYNNE